MFKDGNFLPVSGYLQYSSKSVVSGSVQKYPKSAECETRLHEKDSTIIEKSVRGCRMNNEMWSDVVSESVQRLGLLQLSGCICHLLEECF